jgi:4-amino-4-deoxy-L-arabinose transferase-like glycosyltransferase
MKLLRDFLSDDTVSRRRDLILLSLVFGVLFIQFLGHLPLLDPDEGRYAEIPREMLERGDFITPYLNYVKYFEKPVLLYWLNAISFTIFGLDEFAARLPCALSGLGTVLFTYHVGRELFGRRTGILSAVVLGTSLGFLIQSRMNITDIPLTFAMTVAIGSYALAATGTDRRRWFYLFYLFCGLAVLAKGLIGLVLPGAVVFWHLVLTRRWRLLKGMRIPTGLLVFLATTVPWFLLVSLRNEEFARFFFIHEHFERFLTKVHGRYQPFWFFVPVLLGGLLPWSFLVPSALRGWWRDRREKGGEERLLLVLWAGLIFLFFSKSSSKLIPYILPVYPPLAVLVGNLLDRSLRDFRSLRIPSLILSVFLLLTGAAGIIFPHVAHVPEFSPAAGSIIGGIFVMAGVATLIAARGANAGALILGLAGCSIVLFLVGAPLVMEKVAEHKPYRRFGEAIRKAPEDAVLVTQGVRQGVNFYAGRRSVIFDGSGELEFGSTIGNQTDWFIDERSFKDLWKGERPVVAVVHRDFLRRLEAEGHPAPRILAESVKSAVVANR